MYTSDIENKYKGILRAGIIYLLAAVFCAVFGAVYECFSHEVFSYYMFYAFGFPLVCGTAVCLLIMFFHFRLPDKSAFNLYNSGVAALTVGSVYQGILEIYGTTNRLVSVYWIAGAIFVLLGVVFYAAEPYRKKEAEKIMAK